MRALVSHTLLAALLIALPAAADEIRTEQVQFPRGSSGTTIEGSVSGYNTVHYLLGASSGQVMTVAMRSDNGSNYFNVFAPGATPGEDAALFIGNTEGNRYQGTLPKSGDYTVQVYLMRNAARRNDTASYAIDFSIDSAPPQQAANGGDAKVAGTDFHATGTIPCAQGEGQPMSACQFGVKRGQGYGNAELWVTLPDGSQRVINFEDGAPVSSNTDTPLTAGRNADLNTVTIGSERYEIPDAAILGG